jgi:CspA family cold shock protein
MTGEILRLHSDKKFGFIKGEDKKDYFFHQSALKNCNFDQLQKGQEVTFEDAEGEKGLRAEDIYV